MERSHSSVDANAHGSHHLFSFVDGATLFDQTRFNSQDLPIIIALEVEIDIYMGFRVPKYTVCPLQETWSI